MRILETKQLYLRNLTQEDYSGLCQILQDEEVMYAYEHAFSHEEVQEWLDRQIMRYKEHCFGLWAVIHKETGILIGQAGLTMQNCGEKQVVEIGYLFKKNYWHKGYATEAAEGCKKYAFEKLNCQTVYSIIRDNNIPSQNVALRNGMKKGDTIVKHYYNIDMPHYVYSVSVSG